ncbi:unnamed protein product [Linum trigynum]|uniref:Uncharacterized protein n=1 Tax=Linum trigynum TaxID=586398 RepID=A0AAV2FRB0_9ROSI
MLTNQAMWEKGAWKLTTGDDAIWARFMRGKYGRNRKGIDILSKAKGSSLVWRSYAQTAKTLRKGAAINVKNGKATKFWLNTWLLQDSLLDCATTEVPEDLRGRLVADYWDPGNGWKIQEVEQYLPPGVIDKLRSILIDPLSTAEDNLF